MGIPAINAMDIEGQVATAAVMRAASNSQSNGDFATELDRDLQGKIDPMLTSLVNQPVAAPGKSSSSEDRKTSPPASSLSAVSLAAPAAAVFVTPPNNSSPNNKPPSNNAEPSTGLPKSRLQEKDPVGGLPARDSDLLAETVTTLAIASPEIGLKAVSANRATSAEGSSPMPPSPLPQAFPTGQHGSADIAGSTLRRMDALDTTIPSRLGKGSQSAAAETPAQSKMVTARLGPQDPPSRPDPKTEASHIEDTDASSPSHAVPAEDSSISNQSQTAQVVTVAQTATTLVTGSDATPAAVAALPTKARSGLTVQPLSPDFSPSIPFELNGTESAGRVDDRENSNRMKNLHEGSHAASRSGNDAMPDATPGSLVQAPAQTKSIETSLPVHDAKEPNTSTDKKGGEAALDLMKAVDGKGDLTKTNADPPIAPQLTPPWRAESGHASPEASGASQGRSEAESASEIAGFRANAQTAVSAARLTQQAGDAEMQVRLRTEALGPIDVHTIVKGSDIGASIRVEARETQVMLTNELTQLEQALNQRSLRVEHLDVLQGLVSGGQSNGAGPGNSGGSPSERRSSFSSYPTSQTHISSAEPPPLLEDVGLGLSTTRINLRV